MTKVFILLLFVISTFTSSALSQSSIKGKIFDSTEKKYLEYAVVLVMQEKDSMLVTFTRTSKDGCFNIQGLQSGNYILLISRNNYTDYTHIFTVFPDKQEINLGIIPLITIANLLQEVIVSQSIPKIKIKGDTTEYNADRFKVEPNSTVEDLLKVLPGITVDANGNISANGKRISEVMVDGEPFFSDDPVLVTRNLRSNMINKVQVYDKKSDREAFSGVSLSPPKTVIDLKIKPNKKNGYFGNVLFGAGSNRYHNSEVMYNKFKGKEKFSFFALVTNTSGAGLSSLNIERFSDNSVFTNVRAMADPFDTWDGNFSGEGLPLLQTLGFHYNNKWNGDTQSVNANYKFAHLKVEGRNNIDVIQTLQTGKTVESQSIQDFNNSRFINRINGFYQFNLDSTSTLKFSLDGHTSQKKIASNFESQALEDGKNLLNTQSRRISFTNTSNTFFGDIIWLKKLKRLRRTLSISMSGENNKINSSGNVYAQTNLFSRSINSDTVITDQQKFNNSGESNISSTISYTEPISPNAILSFEFGQAYYRGNSIINSFNKAVDNSYSVVDSSNNSNFSITAPRQKINIQYILTKKKFQLYIGNEYNSDNYRQTDKKNLQETYRRFNYNNPLLSFRYSTNAQTSFSIRYQGVTNVPSFQQLQPLILNINPITQFVGNPNLIPTYTHTFSIGYLKFKMVRNQAFSYNIRFNKIDNNIGLSSNIDSFGRTLYKWININGNHTGSGDVNFSTQIPKLGLFASVRGGIQLEKIGGTINGQSFFARTANYTSGFLIRKSKEKKYSFSIGSSFSYTSVEYNVQTIVSNSFTSIQPNFNLDLFLTKKLQLHIDGNMLVREQVIGFQKIPPVVFLNSWVGLKLLKKENLILKTTINNVFNSNALNMRYVGPAFSSQTNYTVIGRYLFLSLAWNFVSNSNQ
jgi:hypothetical protein